MPMRNLLVCLALLMGTSALSAAQDQTQGVNFYRSGNDFLRVCDDSNITATVRGACLGYVMGVLDGIDLIYTLADASTSKTIAGPTFCFRPDVTMGQKLRVVMQFIKTHPEKSDLPANALIFDAALEAFPCAAKGK
jgi:Rap1a immunity proteins